MAWKCMLFSQGWYFVLIYSPDDNRFLWYDWDIETLKNRHVISGSQGFENE